MHTSLAIKSFGPPPEKYADRIVAEMLHLIIKASAKRLGQIRSALTAMPDGNPKAQQKIVRKLEQLGGPFLLSASLLSSGKRGRYKIGAVFIDGWDATHEQIVHIDDAMPTKPWLACTHVVLTSKGRHDYENKAAVPLMVSHHAMSRLAQRCGAETPIDLLIAVNNIWCAFIDQIHVTWPRDGAHLKFRLTRTLSAFAVLRQGDKGEIVVTTILDTI